MLDGIFDAGIIVVPILSVIVAVWAIFHSFRKQPSYSSTAPQSAKGEVRFKWFTRISGILSLICFVLGILVSMSGGEGAFAALLAIPVIIAIWVMWLLVFAIRKIGYLPILIFITLITLICILFNSQREVCYEYSRAFGNSYHYYCNSLSEDVSLMF